MRLFVEARAKDTHDKWRRVGRHQRTKRFYWYGTSYAASLRHRHQLAGSIDDTPKNRAAVKNWARKRGLVLRLTNNESRKDRFIRLMRLELGTTERPLGSNRGPRVDYYRKATTLWPSVQTGWPWCAAFIVRMALDAGYDLPKDMRTASVWHFFQAARKHGLIVERVPQPGDVVEVFKPGQHVEAVTHVPRLLEEVRCIGGNTTRPGRHGSAYEGTEVAENMRQLGQLLQIVDLERLP